MIGPLQAEIERRLEGYVFGRDADTPQSVVHDLLQAQGRTLAVAESCTGGRVAAALTSVPGASKSFAGGIVAYDNAVKIAQLGVDAATHRPFRRGERRDGARDGTRRARRLGADVALSTTGIAGPSGGSAGEARRFGLVRLSRRRRRAHFEVSVSR